MQTEKWHSPSYCKWVDYRRIRAAVRIILIGKLIPYSQDQDASAASQILRVQMIVFVEAFVLSLSDRQQACIY